MVTTNEEFRCEKCQRTFSTKKVLTRHVRETHEQDATFSCPECGKTFSRNSNLLRHMAVHRAEKGGDNEDRKHVCSHCNARFRQKCHLTEHLLIHTGTRFPCKACDKTFSRMQTLKSHMLTVHGINGHEGSTHDHIKCKKIAYMTHDDHIDFLLSCGSITCQSEERILPDSQLDSTRTVDNFAATHLHCRHENCWAHAAADKDPCDHIRHAKVVKHGDHYDIAFNGFLWNNADEDSFVNHGPFELTEINDGVEGFLEFLHADINSCGKPRVNSFSCPNEEL